VQAELLNRRRWKTRIELADALFEYPEVGGGVLGRAENAALSSR
jgi:hypothetical protein